MAFVAFAALQYNDPDPLYWMAIYLAAAVTCLWVAVSGRVDFRLPFAVFGFAFTLALVQLPVVIGRKSFIDNLQLGEGMRDPVTEVSREVGGLLVVALVMVPLVIVSFRSRALRNKVPAT